MVVVLWAFFRSRRPASRCGPRRSAPTRAGSSSGRLDVRRRLGLRGRPRRGLGDDGRADRLPQPDDDAGDADLRVRRAVLGGIESPVGAIVGGLALGVLTTLLGAYVGFISGELELPAAFVVLFLVLLIRPAGSSAVSS